MLMIEEMRRFIVICLNQEQLCLKKNQQKKLILFLSITVLYKVLVYGYKQSTCLRLYRNRQNQYIVKFALQYFFIFLNKTISDLWLKPVLAHISNSYETSNLALLHNYLLFVLF